MKVKKIYEIYLIPLNLQIHMLNVAALAEIILNNWIGKEVDKEVIIQACIFHDMAKPITFKISKQAQFGFSLKEISKLKRLQKQLKTDYGSNEHIATIKICKEIGLSSTTLKHIDNLKWDNIPRLLKENKIESLIPIYCDMRIGPKGILLLNERLKELKERVGTEDYEDNVRNGNALENLINQNIRIDINSITKNEINKCLNNLLNSEI